MRILALGLGLLAATLSGTPAQAQAAKLLGAGAESTDTAAVSGGIVFSHDAWADILKKAKAENKMIFMDCYTVWCGPCKQLARTVFKDPQVGTLMNDKFINVKVDMEKGEGIDLKNRFDVKAFPTLLFFSPSGEVEHRIVGSVPSAEFIREANVALSGKGLNAYLKKYRAGVRDTAFLREYIQLTGASYLKEEAGAATKEYFDVVGMPHMLTANGWKLFKDNINDPYTPLFLYFWNNRPLFVEKVGQKEVSQKTNMVWNTHARTFTKRVGDKLTFDEKGFNSYLEYMKKVEVRNIEDIKFYTLLDVYGSLNSWGRFADLMDERIRTKNDIGLMMLYNYPMRLEQKCADASLRERASKWVDEGIRQASGKESAKMWFDSLTLLKEKLSKPLESKK